MQYPWGKNYLTAYANVKEEESKSGSFYLEQTCAVDLYPQGASPYKVMDMAGNVWEWCLNKLDDTENISIDDSNGRRVLRGGSWYFNPDLARSANRHWLYPDYRDLYVGFRVVCSLPYTEH